MRPFATPARWFAGLAMLCLSLPPFCGAQAPAPLFAATLRPVEDAEPLDINTASERELQALPGMGAAYARRVVEGRPYTAKNQLLTRGVLPPAAYEAIRDRIVAHRPSP